MAYIIIATICYFVGFRNGKKKQIEIIKKAKEKKDSKELVNKAKAYDKLVKANHTVVAQPTKTKRYKISKAN